MEEKKYEYIPAVRRSALWQMRKSPAHYKYAVEHEPEPTPALLFGIAAHMAILEPERFEEEYIVAPEINRRTKAGKEEWAALIATGKSILTKEDAEKIEAMRQQIPPYYFKGRHEVPVVWTDPATGERCKCRLDSVGDGIIVDYKTTSSCADGVFERDAIKYGYQLQAAMYCEGWFQAHMEEMRFIFVAQEKNPPYACRVYHCDPGWVAEGKAMYRELLDMYHQCRVFDRWPSYEEVTLYGN